MKKILSLPERLKAHCRACGQKVRPGVSDEELRNFESKYGVCLPEDMKAFYRTTDGIVSSCRVFFPLDDLKPLAEELGNDPVPSGVEVWETWLYFVFATFDYAIFYAVRLSLKPVQENRVIVTYPDLLPEERLMATSFTAFAELYLKDPWALSG